jgi:outer membrane protein
MRRLPTACVLLPLLAGCSANSADWFHPDWDRLMREEDSKGSVPPEAIPRTEALEQTTLPDLSAGGPADVSVEQAVLLALRRNRDLKVAELTPVVVGSFEKIERGPFDPEVFAEGSFSREEAIETARSTGEQFAVRGNDTAIAAGVRQTLPSGADVTLDVSQTRDISNRTPEQQTARVGLTVTQALLRGFGPAVNLAAVRQAQLETEASRYELRGFIEALLAETEIAYWRFVLAQRKIEIFERSLEIARRQSDAVQQRIEVGVLPRTEAAAARSEIAVREQALIDARSELQAARLLLLRLMDAPLNRAGPGGGIVPTSDLERAPEALDDLDARIALAGELRPDLNEARLRVDQNRLETIRTRNGLLPRLDLFIALGKTGYATTFFDSFSELDGPTYDFTVGLGFSQFIGRSAAEGAYEGALASRLQAAEAVKNLEQLVELDVYLAANDAERARQQIDASATTRQLQEETVQAEIERFDVGASTTLLVAQAQRDLLESQINEVESITNYRIALILLYLAEGSLLERRGIAVTEPDWDEAAK